MSECFPRMTTHHATSTACVVCVALSAPRVGMSSDSVELPDLFAGKAARPFGGEVMARNGFLGGLQIQVVSNGEAGLAKQAEPVRRWRR